MAWYNQSPIKTVKSAGSSIVSGAKKAVTDPVGAAKDAYEYGKDLVTDKNPYAQGVKAVGNIAEGDFKEAAGNTLKSGAYALGGMIGGKIGGAVGGSAVGGAVGGAAAPIAGTAIGTAVGSKEIGEPIKDGVVAGAKKVGDLATALGEAITGDGGPSAGSPGLTTALAGQTATSATLADKLNNLQPAVAPTVARPAPVQIQAAPGTVVQQPMQVQAAQVAPTQAIQPVAAVRMQGYQAPTTARVAPVQAAQVAAVAPAVASQAQAAQINTAASDQLRAKQVSAVQGLEDDVAGRGGPSPAELMRAKAAEETAKKAMGMAAARARGGNIGLALMDAANTAADADARSAQDMAILRAQERDTARGRLIQALEGTRGQDVNLATTQAGLSNQANLTNAQLGTQTSLANLGEQGQRARLAAQLEQEARQADATRSQQANLADSAADAEARRFTAGEQNKGSLQTQQLDTERSLTQAKLDLEKVLTQAKLEQEAGIFNADTDAKIKSLQAQIASDESKFNTAESNKYANADADRAFEADRTNLEALIKSRGLDIEEADKLRQAMLESQKATLSAEGSKYAADKQAEWEKLKAKYGLIGSALDAGGGILGTLLSDKREKKSIAEALTGEEDELIAALRSLKPSEFEYKNPSKPGARPGRVLGVMTEDLKRTPAGARLVKEEGGREHIDVGQATGFLLAALSRVNDRIDKLGKKGARK